MFSRRRTVVSVVSALVVSSFMVGRGQLATDLHSAQAATDPLATAQGDAPTKKQAAEIVGKLPLHFEANQGQSSLPGVDFISRGNGFTVFLTSQGPIVALQEIISAKEKIRREKANQSFEELETAILAKAVVGMQLLGADPGARAESLEPMPGRINYILGRDPDNWVSDVATYGRVRYQGVYPGIDLVYYGNQRNLEYDFVVAPGADPAQVRLSLQGMDRAELDAAGNLVVITGSRRMVQHRPVMYQELDGTKRQVSGGYVLDGTEATFELGAYDHGQPLVIDPTFTFGTFLGGDGEDSAFGIAIDPAGNIYVSGVTNSLSVEINRATDPPTTNPCPYNLAGSNCANGVPFPITQWWGSAGPPTGGVGNPNQTPNGSTCCGGNDTGRVFVAKLNPTGTTLLYASYLGGFAGYRSSPGTSIHAPCPLVGALAGGCGGAASYARGWDQSFGLDVDRLGRAYVVGHAESLDFPTTADAMRKSHPGPMFPGSPGETNYRDHPRDGFLSIFEPNGQLRYSTLIGGHGSDETNGVTVVDTGAFQGVWIAGLAQSTDFFTCTTPSGCGPASPGPGNPDGLPGMPAVNSYQVELNQAPCTNSGPRTFAGGTVNYPGGGPAMVGCTRPITAPVVCHDPATNELQDGTNGKGMACWRDTFVIRFAVDAKTVLFSTLLGGTGDDGAYGVKVDPTNGNAYVVGEAESSDYPTTAGAVQTCHNGNGGYPADFFAPATNSTNAPNAGRGFPSSYTGYTPQAPVTSHLATSADITPGSIFPCQLSPSPQTWDFEGATPTQKWKPNDDAAVAKFAPTGTLLYSSYLGGSGDDAAGAAGSGFTGGQGPPIDWDRLGNVYVSGWTESRVPYCGTPPGSSAPDCDPALNDPRRAPFPTTLGAFQTALAQDPTTACAPGAPPDCVPPNKRHHSNSFVIKIDTTKSFAAGGWNGVNPAPTGTGFVWSTYLGGYGDDEAYGVVVERGLGTGCPAAGVCNPAVYVVGFTDSFNFPICGNALGPVIGPNCQQGALDTATPGSAAMTSPHYNGRYLNGNPPDFARFPPNPATGFPGGYDPTTPPQYTDAFVTKLKADGSGLVYSTYLGGRADEEGHQILYVNIAGFKGVYVIGMTNSDGRGYCGQGNPSTPQVGSGTIPPPPTWTCAEQMNIPPGNPFPTSVGAFQTRHAPSRVDPGTGSYPNAVLCTGPSSPGWTGADPDCRNTPVPANPNEDVFIVKIAD